MTVVYRSEYDERAVPQNAVRIGYVFGSSLHERSFAYVIPSDGEANDDHPIEDAMKEANLIETKLRRQEELEPKMIIIASLLLLLVFICLSDSLPSFLSLRSLFEYLFAGS